MVIAAIWIWMKYLNEEDSQVYNLNTWEEEAGGPEIQDQLQVLSKSEDI